MQLLSVLLDSMHHLFVNLLEQLEISQIFQLICVYGIKSVILYLTPVDRLSERVLLEPLVQRFLTRIVLFSVQSDGQEGLGLLQSVLEQLDVLCGVSELLFFILSLLETLADKLDSIFFIL